MQVQLLKAKVHRATITDANIHYEGSITLDPVLMEVAGFHEFEKVLVVDIQNGARFDTYIIKGTRGSGTVCVNGAAARLVQKGDLCIVMAFGQYTPQEAQDHQPVLVQVDENNQILAVSPKKE